MMESMDAARIIGYLKGKSILITGSTGFLGKILVEKILRVQPHVHKVYLLVRAIDAPSAKQRVQQEVIGTELFGLLRDKYGEGFDSFIGEKIVALAGDITGEDLGLDAPTLHDLPKHMDVIVNIAATTNFYERYDVSLDVNVMGVKHLCQFAKQCANLKMLMHVSTAYVSGDSAEVIVEKPLKPGWSLREGVRLDIDAELRLVADAKKDLIDGDAAEQKKAMKQLGLQRARHHGWSNSYVFTKAMGEMLLGQLRGDDMPVVIMRPSVITSVRADPVPGWIQGTRTIDTLIIGYAKQSISCFLGDLSVVVDCIPGDMVANAMMAAMVAHSEEKLQAVYQATSSLRNPVTYAVLYRSGGRHFEEHPRVGHDGQVIPNRHMRFFSSIPRFRLYMVLAFKLPLEILHVANILLCGLFDKLYDDYSRKYKFVMHLVDVYGPFAFFRGCFDDTNLERLRSTMAMKSPQDEMFNFDPKSIDWDDYFYRTHIPGVLKYVCK